MIAAAQHADSSSGPAASSRFHRSDISLAASPVALLGGNDSDDGDDDAPALACDTPLADGSPNSAYISRCTDSLALVRRDFAQEFAVARIDVVS